MNENNAQLLARTLDQWLNDIQLAFVVSNPREPDNPIVYASERFFTVTGYKPSEVLGKNCRFLQGPRTSRQAVAQIRDAICEERSATVKLLNYRKDGAPFLNCFHLSPIKGTSGVVEYYIGIQSAVREDTDAEGIEAVAQQEANAADNIAQQVLQHDKEIKSARAHTCAVDVSVPSCLLCGLSKISEAFVLSDPNLPDCPIVYASPSFLKLTEYSCDELLGRNCRLLQGPETDATKVQEIRDWLADLKSNATPPRPLTITLLNYKKSGQPFYNLLHLAPLRDADGHVRFISGVQVDVSKPPTPPGIDAAMLTIEEEAGVKKEQQQPPAVQEHTPSPIVLLRQRGVVGALKVATRSLSEHGLRRAKEDQHLPSPLARNGTGSANGNENGSH